MCYFLDNKFIMAFSFHIRTYQVKTLAYRVHVIVHLMKYGEKARLVIQNLRGGATVYWGIVHSGKYTRCIVLAAYVTKLSKTTNWMGKQLDIKGKMSDCFQHNIKLC